MIKDRANAIQIRWAEQSPTQSNNDENVAWNGGGGVKMLYLCLKSFVVC